jgi:hypothetical protein
MSCQAGSRRRGFTGSGPVSQPCFSVVGSIILRTSVILVAGKPLISAKEPRPVPRVSDEHGHGHHVGKLRAHFLERAGELREYRADLTVVAPKRGITSSQVLKLPVGMARGSDKSDFRSISNRLEL